MARKPSARVVLNRASMSRVELALADGLGAVATAILQSADPPDATPYGTGLVDRGGMLVYIGDRKVAGMGLDGRQPRKPRSVRVRGTHGTQAIVGFGFPGRFQELGTIRHAAQPFLTPAADRVLPMAPRIMAAVVGPALKRIR
jgi:hypothetical protein